MLHTIKNRGVRHAVPMLDAREPARRGVPRIRFVDGHVVRSAQPELLRLVEHREVHILIHAEELESVHPDRLEVAYPLARLGLVSWDGHVCITRVYIQPGRGDFPRE